MLGNMSNNTYSILVRKLVSIGFNVKSNMNSTVYSAKYTYAKSTKE